LAGHDDPPGRDMQKQGERKMVEVIDIYLTSEPPQIFFFVKPEFDGEKFRGKYGIRLVLLKPFKFAITDPDLNPYTEINLELDENRELIKNFLRRTIKEGICKITTIYTLNSEIFMKPVEQEIHIDTPELQQMLNIILKKEEHNKP
jgi:hypothetical protein